MLLFARLAISTMTGKKRAPSTPKRTPKRSRRLQAQNQADNVVLPGGALLMSFQLDGECSLVEQSVHELTLWSVPPRDDADSLAPISENSSLEDLDPLTVPPELKKEGSDWFAIFNPKVKRTLDVNLVYTLHHERYDKPVLPMPPSVADLGVVWRQRGGLC